MPKLRSIGLALVLSPSFVFASVEFRFVDKGSTPNYQYKQKTHQDLSAAAYYNKHVLLGFDGGKNSEFPEIRLSQYSQINQPAIKIQRQMSQQDIEGATYVDGVFLISSSLSQANEDTSEYRLLTGIEFNSDWSIRKEHKMPMRDLILSALNQQLKDPHWYARIAPSFGKLGGLNVEGLSVSHKNPKRVIFGLRSPLSGASFGAPTFGDEFSLFEGDAILVEVSSPLTYPAVTDVITLPLNGHGIRGMEYIDAIKGYLIIGGPVPKQTQFSLWFYQPETKTLEKLNIKHFEKLCRPEAVLSNPDLREIIILSESSGKACQGSSINYIKLAY
ncbi:hypothetical protein [Agaribacterium haliotis]|uniref:hypothetical protein n=1 Tax=Agaribacterium haliotis TaxID=2013869 RepID=UPI0011774719|nr:hypothetical protein [Agaribacterium haliotis]